MRIDKNKLFRYVQVIKTINRFSKKYLVITLFLKIFTLFSTYLLLFVNKNVINALAASINHGSIDISYILSLLIISGIIDAFTMLLFNTLQYQLGKIKLKYDDYISVKIASSLAHLDMSYYDDPEGYNQTMHINKCKNAILDTYNNLLDLLFAFASLLIAIIVVIQFSFWLLLLSFISVLPGMILQRKIQMDQYDAEKQLINKQREINYYTGLFFNKNTELEMQLFNTSGFLIEKLMSKQEEVRNVRLKTSLKRAKKEGSRTLISKSFYILQQLLLVFEIVKKGLTIGDFTYYSGVANNLTASIGQLVSNINALHLNGVKYDDFHTILSRPSRIDNCGSRNIEYTSVSFIEFKNVSFRYPKAEKYVLKNVSLTIRKNDKVAIVGQNGAGKTTLIKLLLRFYEPTEGCIFYNGVNIKEYDLNEYRSVFSSMFQELLIYMLPICENVAFSNISRDKSIDKRRVRNVLSDLDMNQVNGEAIDIDKYCGKEFYADGYSFSTGQKQRIHAARTLYRRSQCFVFDEPASSMDAIAESKFLNTLMLYTGDKIVIYITHRYNNLKMMNNIFVFEHGELKESGTHDELINQNGLYKHMFSLQNKE